MKQTAKRILAFVSVVCIAFLGIVTMPFVQVNAETQEIVFELGENGTASHSDGSTKSETYDATVDGYKLSLTGGTNMYTNARDAKGNGCFKLGASSKAGGFTISNIPADVTSVVIAVAQYKANTTKMTVAGTSYTITTASNNGDYTNITVDTSSTKTIALTTVSGGYRAMVNTITYMIESGETGEPVEPEVPQPSITLTGDGYTQVGGTLTIAAAEENLTEDVVWTSSNTDVATVAGGVVTAKAMGKTTIKATANGVEATKDIIVYPAADSELTLAQALQVCELTGTANAPYTYSTTGTIANIDTVYSSQYNNITVTITDGADNNIKAYRMAGGEELAVGAKIKVTGTLVNYNGNTPEFIAGCIYELLESDVDVEGITSDLNAIDAYMSLGYKYTQTTDNVVVSAGGTDTLVVANTGRTSTTYGDWSYTAPSGVAYAGNSSKSDKGAIQMRSNNSNSGIVTTTSGGKATKVVVAWNSASSGKTLDIYGSNTAFTAATQLYSVKADSGIEKIGSMPYGTTELEITGDYAYIGLRSYSGALYLDSVSITWENEGAEGGETVEKVTLSDSDFRLKCGIDASVSEIADIDSYGIRVSAGNKTVEYTSDANSWATDDEGVSYVLLTLGDIINDVTKLTTEFTVEAYVVVDGVKFTSEKTKTYSVASMIAEYKTKGYDVEHLYNHLVEIGAIKA